MMSIQSHSRIIPAATGAVRPRVSPIPAETPAGSMNTRLRRQAKEPLGRRSVRGFPSVVILTSAAISGGVQAKSWRAPGPASAAVRAEGRLIYQSINLSAPQRSSSRRLAVGLTGVFAGLMVSSGTIRRVTVAALDDPVGTASAVNGVLWVNGRSGRRTPRCRAGHRVVSAASGAQPSVCCSRL